MVSTDLADSTCAVLISVISDHTDHELVEAIGATLNAVDGAVGVVYSARGEDSAVTWRAERVRVALFVDLPDTRLESSSEKVGESSIFSVLSCCFFNFNSVYITEKSEQGRSCANWYV